MNPICRECEFQHKSREVGIPRELIVDIMMHMRFGYEDEDSLLRHFGADLNQYGKTLEEVLEALKTYRDHCPFYHASASELFEQREQILKEPRSKILLFLIEPNSIQNRIISKILEDKGYHIISASNETNATCYFEKYQNEISITIIEFSMPHGLKLIEHIETTKPQMNILTCSGDSTCSVVQGCDYCVENLHRKRLLKPYYIDNLLIIVNDFEKYTCELKDKCEPLSDFRKNKLY